MAKYPKGFSMNRLACPSVDTNFLNSNNFTLVIERLPTVSFFTNMTELPSISLSPLSEATPLSTLAIPGDKLEFGSLSVTFYVDSKMDNYLEVFKWMQGLGFPENHTQYTTENNTRDPNFSELQRNYSDAKLISLDAGKVFTFVDCYPTRLSGIRFETQTQDVNYAVATVDLEYSYFTIDNV